jgi:RimJ/RimL family protein N-acetyltransferase
MSDTMMQSSRVLLTAIEPEDIPAIVRWRNLPEVYCGFIEYAPLSRTQQAAFLSTLSASGSRRLWLINARDEPGDAVPIGCVGVMDLDWRNRRCEFGPIFIGEMGYRRRGLAREAEILALDYCFNHLGMHKVIAHVPESNAEIIGLHESSGFRRDLLLRDHIFRRGRFEGLHLLSCLEDEFRALAITDLHHSDAGRS